MDPALEKLAQAEEKKVWANAKYRTSAATLRRLSKAHVVYELPEARRGAWDRFSMRHIGLAVQKKMAKDFDGDAEAMRKAAVAQLARQLHLDQRKINAREQAVVLDFAMVLSLVPEFSQWPANDKAAVRSLVAEKAARTELRYQQLLQQHDRLRKALLRIGSKQVGQE
jgi:hypothetical protein